MYRKSILQTLFMLCFLVIIQIQPAKLFAQVTSDQDVEEFEKKKKIAEAKKAIAEAQKGELEAKFPKLDPSAATGKTTVKDGDFIESRILGYCAMKTAAQRIARQIDNKMSGTIVIYNEADVQKIARYNLMMKRLKFLQRSYDEIVSQFVGEVRGVNHNYNLPSRSEMQAQLGESRSNRIAPGLIASTALNFLSLLKTDVELIPGKEFDIGEKEFVAEVFSNLKNFNPYYPKMIPVNAQLAEESPLFTQIIATADANDTANFLSETELGALRNNLEAKLILLASEFEAHQKGTLPLKPEEVDAKTREKKTIEAKISLIKFFSSQLDKLNSLFTATIEELGFEKKKNAELTPAPVVAQCPEKTCLPTTINVNVAGEKEKQEEKKSGDGGKDFLNYLQAESLYHLMEKSDAYWLDLQVIKASGNLRVKSNIVTNIFIGQRVNFSGGSIVYFNVFDHNGISKVSGVVPAYQKFMKSSRIDKICGREE